MSATRCTVFTCDTCGREALAQDRAFKMPEGWKYESPAGGRSTHTCVECQEPVYDTPVPEYAHVMTVKEFSECVAVGGFIPHDGHGHPVKGDCMDRRRGVFPPIDIPLDATHVAWFNK